MVTTRKTAAATKEPRSYTTSLTGMRARSPLRLAEIVREGIPYKTLEVFGQRSGLTVSGVAALIDVPDRTLMRRRSEGRLTANESDRFLRVARIFGLAVSLFEGDVDAAKSWFERPQRGLANAAPSTVVRTDVGAREIERLIGRLEHGVVV